MKNHKTPSLLLLFIITISMLMYLGCSKDRIQEPAKTNLYQYDPVNTYLDTKKQQEQEFIIDSAGTAPIVGNQGTRIWIAKQCLMFPNGDSVSWPFTVKLVELYKPKDMIYYQMPTMSAGDMLETGGEIRLRAFKNGTELVLKNGCATQIEMPSLAPKNYMKVYNGTINNALPDWVENSPAITFNATAIGYKTVINQLGWINCDYKVGNGSGSRLSFASSTDDLQNVGIFVFVPATKTVMQVYNMNSDLIPNGTALKVVAIGIDSNGQLFSYDQALTISANTQIQVTMNAITDANLTTYLDGL